MDRRRRSRRRRQNVHSGGPRTRRCREQWPAMERAAVSSTPRPGSAVMRAGS